MTENKRPRAKLVLRESSEEIVQFLAKELSITPLLAGILVGRGLSDFEASRQFFNPDLSQLHSPFLFNDMKSAVDRVLKAVEQKETVAVYGDYDVDGITATALLVRVLRKLGISAVHYLPDRFSEGYGISETGIDTLIEMGARLIITVDCGITAVAETVYARDKGVDIIITDHHEPQNTLPLAVAILDPKVVGENYPDKSLAGVGVAFKLAQALGETLNLPDTFWKDELDLAALGSAADIVPLVGENRLIAAHGYAQMQYSPNCGLASLMAVQGIAGHAINTSDIVFKLTPVINAAGRLGDPRRGLKLFLSDNEEECTLFANELVRVNNERKAHDKALLQEALLYIQKHIDLSAECAIVAGDVGWHQGVMGIVASKVVEHFYRPAFLFTIGEDGVAHGSGRSIVGCDLLSALTACENLLITYGGHKVAAGATLRAENLPEFRRRFNEAVAYQLTAEQLVPIVYADAEVRISQLTSKFLKILKRMEPFGPGNMRPVLLSRNVAHHTPPRTVGKTKEHLKLTVYSEGIVMDAIGFGFGNRLQELLSVETFTLVYTLDENVFRGKTTLQLQIKGIEIENPS